jgi:hypothetical protein
MTVTIALRVPGGNKAELFNSHGLFSISMGIDKILMREDCLKKTIHEINTTLKSCHIVVSDSLQRFNLMMRDQNLSEEDAFKISCEIGNQWLKHNVKILDEFLIPYKLFRWTDWLTKNDYKDKHKFVSLLFESDTNFRMAVAESIKKYYERKTVLENPPHLHYYLEPHFELAHRFILEEAAVMLVWCDAGYDFELHTSNRNAALAHVHRYYYQNNNIVNLKPSRIKVLGNYDSVSKAA